MPFEPFIGTHDVALGIRVLGPPSDLPATDRTCWLEGSRYTSLWLLKLDFTYFWIQLCP